MNDRLTYLKSATKRANAALSGVGSEPGSMAPGDGAVAAGDNLVRADDELYEPHMRMHLPHHEASSLRQNSVRINAIPPSHRYLPRRKHVLHPPFQLRATRRRPELLYYVLRRRRHLLHVTILNKLINN